MDTQPLNPADYETRFRIVSDNTNNPELREAAAHFFGELRSYRDERPNLCDQLAAENLQHERGLHLRRLARQAKWRGRFELAVMVGVAVFLGFAIGVQL